MSEAVHPIVLLGVALVFAMLPIFLGVATSYLKVSIVLGMVKSALGTQNVPGPLVTMSLSMAITIFVMAPVFEASMNGAAALNLDNMMKGRVMPRLEDLTPIAEPWRGFLEAHTGSQERRMLEELARSPDKDSASDKSSATADLSWNADPAINQDPGREPGAAEPTAEVEKPEPLGLRVLFLAFMLSELKEAFAMSFLLLIPFLVVDLVVANILSGLGMMMVSPVLMSLPLKLLLFVQADGWLFIVRGLLRSYDVSL